MVEPKEIIATINPNLYNKKPQNQEEKDKLEKVKELAKKGKFIEATKEANPQSLVVSGDFNGGYSQEDEGFKLDLKGIDSSQKITYETYAESLEPIYFYLLDLMDEFGLKPAKIIDNFTSSPGSAHFSEMGQKKTIMQQQASKLLGDINTVVRSILNLVYDLKEFKIRLEAYENLKDKDKKNLAILSLKQIWMDKVDVNKGNSSIKAMAFGQSAFVTLIDAFLKANTIEEVDNLDLNDRVIRIVKERLIEFDIWMKESEGELRKRYEIEKNYLRSQVSSLQLYTRWAKPYLQSAKELEQGDSKNPGLVKAFNRTILQLTLMGKRKFDPIDSGRSGALPNFFSNRDLIDRLKKKGDLRDYTACVLVDFVFRAVPQQGAFIGRVEITFSAYALNNEELKQFDKLMNEDDLDSGLKLIQGITDDSLGELKKDIDYFLEEKSEEQKKKEAKENSNDVNPFLALIGYYDWKKEDKKEESKDKKKEEFKPIREDNYYEEYLRSAAAADAVNTLFTLFDVYKKSHGMASYS